MSLENLLFLNDTAAVETLVQDWLADEYSQDSCLAPLTDSWTSCWKWITDSRHRNRRVRACLHIIGELKRIRDLYIDSGANTELNLSGKNRQVIRQAIDLAQATITIPVCCK